MDKITAQTVARGCPRWEGERGAVAAVKLVSMKLLSAICLLLYHVIAEDTKCLLLP